MSKLYLLITHLLTNADPINCNLDSASTFLQNHLYPRSTVAHQSHAVLLPLTEHRYRRKLLRFQVAHER